MIPCNQEQCETHDHGDDKDLDDTHLDTEDSMCQEQCETHDHGDDKDLDDVHLVHR